MNEHQPELQPQQPRCIDLTVEQSERLNQAAGPDSWGTKFIVLSRALEGRGVESLATDRRRPLRRRIESETDFQKAFSVILCKA